MPPLVPFHLVALPDLPYLPLRRYHPFLRGLPGLHHLWDQLHQPVPVGLRAPLHQVRQVPPCPPSVRGLLPGLLPLLPSFLLPALLPLPLSQPLGLPLLFHHRCWYRCSAVQHLSVMCWHPEHCLRDPQDLRGRFLPEGLRDLPDLLRRVHLYPLSGRFALPDPVVRVVRPLHVGRCHLSAPAVRPGHLYRPSVPVDLFLPVLPLAPAHLLVRPPPLPRLVPVPLWHPVDLCPPSRPPVPGHSLPVSSLPLHSPPTLQHASGFPLPPLPALQALSGNTAPHPVPSEIYSAFPAQNPPSPECHPHTTGRTLPCSASPGTTPAPHQNCNCRFPPAAPAPPW